MLNPCSIKPIESKLLKLLVKKELKALLNQYARMKWICTHIAWRSRCVLPMLLLIIALQWGSSVGKKNWSTDIFFFENI